MPGASQLEGASPRSRRTMQRKANALYLQRFMDHYGYESLHSVRRIVSETVCPIHVASYLGDARLLRLLLALGADPSRKTNLGRRAEDVARAANKEGSHDVVLHMLSEQVKVTSMQKALELMKHNCLREVVKL
ncbi:unnamed protein product [Effrenium voratum]|nr:unnamed protein product [Effrenium voratum]